MRSLVRTEPAALVGFLVAVIVLVAQQAIAQGIVSSTGTVNLLNLVISTAPLIGGLIIRNLVYAPANVTVEGPTSGG